MVSGMIIAIVVLGAALIVALVKKGII
jgi:hypothetical protein